MDIYIEKEEAAQLIGAAEFIIRLIGRAQGRVESYEARRERWGQEQEKGEQSPFPKTLAGIISSELFNKKQAAKLDSELKTRAEASFYSEEEIKRMPKLKDGHFRITRDGLWQVRYRRDGYDIQFTAKNRQAVVDKFREWVRSVNDKKKDELPKKKQLFFDFSEWYFENVKRVNVDEETCNSQHRSAELHIYPILGGLPLRQVTAAKCQELLNGIIAQGKGRTSETVKFLLGEILRAAVGQKLISDNPMQYVKIPNHVRENGEALPLEAVSAFMKACEESKYCKQFMVYLYAGIRRNEIHSLQMKGDFISVICGKCRKGQKPRRREIPIAPALRPFLPLSEEELSVKNDVLTRAFKRICKKLGIGDHCLNDLRHTFITRTQECGISKPLVDVWTDHVDKKDMTQGVYTHFSREYQLKEIENLEY